MSYTANQYNYATPLSSTTGLYSENSVVTDAKYFTLSDNVLDGSYQVLSGDVGLWGSAVSYANGTLLDPFVVTITEEATMHSFRFVSSSYAYPVAFTVKFYNGSELLYTITELYNDKAEYMHYLPSTLYVTHYEISISKISKQGAVARLYNIYNPPYIRRSEEVSIGATEVGHMGLLLSIRTSDRFSIYTEDKGSLTNILGMKRERARIGIIDESNITNIHSVMKAPSRRVYGKVYITYTDPIQALEVSASASGEAYHSDVSQITTGSDFNTKQFFRLYDNDLTGNYAVISSTDHVGWVSDVISDENGYFENNPYVTISLTSVPMSYLSIYFDENSSVIPEDFVITFNTISPGITLTKTFTGNTLPVIEINTGLPINVTSVTIEISKVSKPFSPASILAVPVQSTFLYVGYQDRSDLISIDMLEELTYNDDIEALGGVSANEVTVVLDNSYKVFNANNPFSPIAAHLRRNRRIVPWLGAEVVPGEIEWYCLGTYWSYKWDVPTESLTASVVGFDTIGLLSTTPFKNHTMQLNKSLGSLIEYVLTDAKQICSFIDWHIDDALYDIIVPYAWFDNSNHAAALRRISETYPMHIYCDRQGRICAAPQRLHLDDFNDVWSNSTNVIKKNYKSLHTVLPNVVSVKVIRPVVLENEELVKDSLTFNAQDMPSYSLSFNKPYIDNIAVAIDKDDSVDYSYTAYSWGIMFTFTGSGQVRSITCRGTALDTSNTSVVSRSDEASVLVNGAVVRDVSAHFIQDSSLATDILNRIFNLSEYDKYDAEVDYRGDIALSINDPIRLLDGIAPTDRYNIKRHQLTWDGGLTGTAFLNT